jgi:hypothetical protein
MKERASDVRDVSFSLCYDRLQCNCLPPEDPDQPDADDPQSEEEDLSEYDDSGRMMDARRNDDDDDDGGGVKRGSKVG